jgi:hypothetical protein
MLLLGVTILLLSGCNGGGEDTGGSTGAACQSNCPTAEAGREQAVLTGASVTLDGSGSTSGTPGLITYQWTLLSKPTGSAATLAGATTARPTFTADVAGSYTARLIVHEAGVASPPDTVTITCGAGNLAPIADAGLDRTEQLGTLVTLDGTGRDPNGTPITYAWRVVTQPSGSQAVLLTPTTKTPSFTPQVPGPYTLALTVSDGALTSPADEVVITVTADNGPPIANAGPDQTVTTGQVVTLTGAGSTDPNDDPLTYSWRFQSKPDGSTATVAAATSVSPTFTADRAGLYVLSLVVSDGMRTSGRDTVVIEARLPRFNQGSGFNGRVGSIVLAQDGSGDVYVGGEFTAYNGTVANRLIRLHPDGTVAQTFGQGFDNNVGDLALAKTGGGELYVLGGFTQFDGHPVPPLSRLTRTGSLDTAFQLPADFSGLGTKFAVAEDGSGDLYVTFSRANPNPTVPPPPGDHIVGIARLNADGTVDPAFSTGNSFPSTSSMGCPQTIKALMPTSNGKLYVGGTLTFYNGVSVSSLLRLNSDGTLDSTFRTDVMGSLCGLSLFLALAPAGDGAADFYASLWVGPLIRVRETGASDTSFNADLASLNPRSHAIAVTQDGSGDVLIAPESSALPLVRFNRYGALVTAPTFVTPTMGGGGVSTIVPVSDDTGDVYIGGSLTTYNGAAVNHFARIHADGTLASVVSGP